MSAQQKLEIERPVYEIVKYMHELKSSLIEVDLQPLFIGPIKPQITKNSYFLLIIW